MAVQLTDGTTNNVVDATSKGILVQNPKTLAQAGFAALAAVRDAGSITGAVNATYGDISPGKRQRVGLDTPLFADHINYVAQNTAMWGVTSATMTVVFGSGYANVNAGSSVTSGQWAVLKSYAGFELYGEGSVLAEWHGYLTQTPQANNTLYLGVGIPGTTAGPTDGIYFQFDATGALKGVANWNGTTVASAAFAAPSNNVSHLWRIIIDDTVAEFWIDGVLQASVVLPAGAGTPSLQAASSLFFQNTNTGVVATAQQFRLMNCQVYQMDTATGRSWPHIMAGRGLMGYQGQNGGTMGSTALYTNSLAAGAGAAMTNTTAALGSGLGGQFAAQPTLAAGTDGIVQSYQVPAGSINQTPRSLIITGVRVQSAVTTALVGGPILYAYSLAFGHTAVSMATAEGAATKAPRRIPLGLEAYPATAAIDTLPSVGDPIYFKFDTPVAVQPGEFVAICAKNLGTVTSAGVIVFLITYDCYWE